jgi:hypothetical protein
MKLKEYRQNLNKLAQEHPEYDELEVVYARDDEGNSFQKFNNTPTLGNFEGGYHGDFISKEEFKGFIDDGFYQEGELKVNAVCIN